MLGDTATTHHPTPAAAYVLVENPPEEEWRQLFPSVGLGRWRHGRIGSLMNGTPQLRGFPRLFNTPSNATEQCFADLNVHTDAGCEANFLTRP